MTQLALEIPIARRSDPASSHAAAAEMMGSEKQRSEHQRILAVLKVAAQPLSYREVHSALSGSIRESVEVQRRLNDLRHAGLVRNVGQRKCEISHRLAQTWEAIQ